jgi:hypothetical protein
MNVIVCEVGRAPELREMPNTLKALQDTVGGYIETLHPRKAGLSGLDGAVMIFNEEGRLQGLQPNRLGIVGTLIFAGVKGDQFCSLTTAQVDTVLGHDRAESEEASTDAQG